MGADFVRKLQPPLQSLCLHASVSVPVVSSMGMHAARLQPRKSSTDLTIDPKFFALITPRKPLYATKLPFCVNKGFQDTRSLKFAGFKVPTGVCGSCYNAAIESDDDDDTDDCLDHILPSSP